MGRAIVGFIAFGYLRCSGKAARSQRRRKYIPVASNAACTHPILGARPQAGNASRCAKMLPAFLSCGGRFAPRAAFPSLISNCAAVLKSSTHRTKCSLPKARTESDEGGNAGPRSKAAHARDGVCRAIRDETATLRSGPVFHPDCTGLAFENTHRIEYHPNSTGSAIDRRKKTCFFKQVSSNMVGERGFEPPTHWSQTSCATKLRYSPMGANITAPP